MPPAGNREHDPYSALRNPALRHYLLGNVLAIGGMQMEMLALRWELYERTSDAMVLGYVGLVQVVPVLALALVAGHVADRFNRRVVVIVALDGDHWLRPARVGNGLAHRRADPGRVRLFVRQRHGSRLSCNRPSRRCLPQLVDRADFPNAVTWNSGGFHLATVLGPAVGGVLLASFRSAALIYVLNAAAAATYLVLLLFVKLRTVESGRETVNLKSLVGGRPLRLAERSRVGGHGLDMFAVLLGGATTLMPVFARDILDVGPARTRLDGGGACGRRFADERVPRPPAAARSGRG